MLGGSLYIFYIYFIFVPLQARTGPHALAINCKRFALPASAQPSWREGSGTPKSSVGKVRIPEAGSRQVRQAGLAWLGWATG